MISYSTEHISHSLWTYANVSSIALWLCEIRALCPNIRRRSTYFLASFRIIFLLQLMQARDFSIVVQFPTLSHVAFVKMQPKRKREITASVFSLFQRWWLLTDWNTPFVAWRLTAIWFGLHWRLEPDWYHHFKQIRISPISGAWPIKSDIAISCRIATTGFKHEYTRKNLGI